MLVRKVCTQACLTQNPCSTSCIVLPRAFGTRHPESRHRMARRPPADPACLSRGPVSSFCQDPSQSQGHRGD